ncbi:putative nuclear hormone receptor HR3 isoform X2 [Vespula maculifrons]|uniref:Uncharacterized protein n=2 Tax=Vespula TaxID=7451 RepID=A0A834J802_VESVU|nr:hypothetical protein HZH66_012728 [Vespula vulgaris]
MAESAASPGSVQVAANSPQQQQQQQQQQTQQPPDISSSQLASPPITGTGTGQCVFFSVSLFHTFRNDLEGIEKNMAFITLISFLYICHIHHDSTTVVHTSAGKALIEWRFSINGKLFCYF